MSKVSRFSLHPQQGAILNEMGISSWLLQDKLPTVACSSLAQDSDTAEIRPSDIALEQPEEVLDVILLDIAVTAKTEQFVEDVLLQLGLSTCLRTAAADTVVNCRFVWRKGKEIAAKENVLTTPDLAQLMVAQQRQVLWQTLQQIVVSDVH